MEFSDFRKPSAAKELSKTGKNIRRPHNVNRKKMTHPYRGCTITAILAYGIFQVFFKVLANLRNVSKSSLISILYIFFDFR